MMMEPDFLEQQEMNRWRAKESQNSGQMSKTMMLRIKKDLTEFYAEKMEQIHVVPQEDDMTKMHALITGPADTPYEGGFFYFLVQFPNDYPIRPPQVRLRTTGSNTVRFNPNLYNNGKVCLSILGTWQGPPWSPVLNLNSLLLSIQSLMNEEPYYNEPGYERMRVKGQMSAESKRYNEEVEFQTIKVAVIGMLENSRDAQDMPSTLKDVMVAHFKGNFKKYLDKVLAKISETRPGDKYDYKQLKDRLLNLKVQFGIEDGDAGKVEDTVPTYEAISSTYKEEPKQEVEKPEFNVEDIINDEMEFNDYEPEEGELLYEEDDSDEEGGQGDVEFKVDDQEEVAKLEQN